MMNGNVNGMTIRLLGCALAMLVLAVLFLLYGCAVQRLIYSSRGTMIFLPERPLL